MTEQLIDDLSNEEHEALLLMCGHAVGPPLSPAAQAVLDAFRAVPDLRDCPSIAAALRALDRQLGHEVLGVRCVDCSQIQLIAAELEGAND